jgi:hypothetical protein
VGSGVDGVIEGDAEAVPVVKSQGPNVIGWMDKDTCYGTGFIVVSGVFVGGVLIISMNFWLSIWGSYTVNFSITLLCIQCNLFARDFLSVGSREGEKNEGGENG